MTDSTARPNNYVDDTQRSCAHPRGRSGRLTVLCAAAAAFSPLSGPGSRVSMISSAMKAGSWRWSLASAPSRLMPTSSFCGHCPSHNPIIRARYMAGIARCLSYRSSQRSQIAIGSLVYWTPGRILIGDDSRGSTRQSERAAGDCVRSFVYGGFPVWGHALLIKRARNCCRSAGVCVVSQPRAFTPYVVTAEADCVISMTQHWVHSKCRDLSLVRHLLRPRSSLILAIDTKQSQAHEFTTQIDRTNAATRNRPVPLLPLACSGRDSP